MELLLEVRLPALAPHPRVEVRVELEPETSVSELVAALHAHALARGLGPLPDVARLAAIREPSGQTLLGDDSVAGAGLVSGETLSLVPASSTRAPEAAPRGAEDRHPASAALVALDITTGPEAGRFELLEPGRHVIGRASDCDLRIDDPTVSRQHLAVDVGPDLSVTIHVNPDTANGTTVAGREVTGTIRLEAGDRVAIGDTQLTFLPVAPEDTRIRDRLGQIPFNRVPYKRVVVRDRRLVPLDPPPDTPSPRKLPIGMVLVPLAFAIGIAVVFQRPQMLAFALMSPAMLVYRSVSSTKEGSAAYRRDRAAFLAALEARVAEVEEALASEQRERFRATPDVAEIARQAQLHLPRLWERNRTAPDVMALRLGLGDVPSLVVQPPVERGDPELRAQATSALAAHELARQVPVTADLDELGVIGLHGDRDQVLAVGSALVIQAAGLHSPEDLVLTAGIAGDDLARWSWLKWLPHTRTATSPLEGDHLAVGTGDVDRLLTRLLAVAATRLEGRTPREHQWPRVLLLLDEDAEPDRAVLAQLLDVAPAAGILVVWLGRTEYQLPRQCQATLRCVDPDVGSSVLRLTDPTVDDQELMVEGVRPGTAASIARSLAPIRDASATSVTTAIPSRVLLLDAIGMAAPGPEEVVRRWRTEHRDSLAAPIGVGTDGPFTIDLVAQGPHTLIAGTSGAGKSELLQTVVASLAVHHPPERLSFLFVDYKGGAASAAFADLPHAVGAVSNLDARRSVRALTSLRAELERRMALLEGRARDLAEMLEVAPDEAPPRLVIVVDEFATLVKEIPEFVAGVVDIAQRGRSLGIHLVLATQRPAGAVNDSILANTNLRISLRVLDAADSTAIIGTRDAAEIPVPLRGRAFVRAGPGAVSAFQCAWSGAPYEAAETAAVVTVRPFPFGRGGAGDGGEPAGTTATADGATADRVSSRSHLHVVVQACVEAARRAGAPAARRPWLEPLPEVLPLDTVLAAIGPRLSEDPGRFAVLGMADEPEQQAQRPEVVDLEASGGLLVVGTGGAGKTTTLRTIAAGMVAQGGPDAVQLYVLDHAGRSLAPLGALPHTVVVATGDDLELVTRVLTLLRGEIGRRRALLAEHRAESVSELRRRAGTAVVPRIVVLLDGYSTFHSTFDKPELFGWLGELQRILTDGRQVGLHGIVATDRRMGVPAALYSALGTRLALRMSSPEELAALGVPSKVAKGAELGEGRGYVDGLREVQVACISEPGGAAQAEALEQVAEKALAAGVVGPPPLPELPDVVRLASPPSGPLRVPLGLGDLRLDVVEVDLARQNLVITGPPLSGRSLALLHAARTLSSVPDPPALVAVGGPSSPLADQGTWTWSGFTRASVLSALEAAVDHLGDDDSAAVRMILCIDTAEDVDAPDRAKLLERLVRSDEVRVLAVVDGGSLAKAYSGWMSELRRNRALLFMQPAPKGEIDVLAGVRPALRPGQPMPPGRAVLVADRGWRLLQTALPDGFEPVPSA